MTAAQRGDSDRPPVTDRTDATDAEFEARLERLDRLEVADESAVERVARAIWESLPDYGYSRRPWERLTPGTHETYRRFARVAIDAFKPPPPDGGDVR